ncbi:MAG: single-stranded DNA-binding protein, partial [Candidatus Peribacteraceae bacterium]|nr:single-stranded DNA-binding protein [Candidatus Peribacteraceae bacterium]
MYLNRITIIGRLVADPEFQKGSAEDGSNDRVWSRLAVNRPGSEEADFVPFCCWGATARAVSDHCHKGKVLILDGQLRTRSKQRADQTWDNYFEVNCNAVYFGPDSKGTKNAPAPAETTPAPAVPVPDEATAQALRVVLAQLSPAA